MIYDSTTAPGTCGLGIIYNFNGNYGNLSTKKPLIHDGGTPYFVAGFVNNNACRQMYEWLCKEAELVYQTPVTQNKNSGRMFFSCMFKSLTARHGFDIID